MVGRQEDKQKNRQATINWLCFFAMVEFKRRQRKKKAEAFVNPNTQTISRPCDVFINHRGFDTKRNIAGLLYDHLSRQRLKPFMDSRNMKPGDKLPDQIHSASFFAMVEFKRRQTKNKAEAFVNPNTQTISRPCDVFINHRGIDTKRNIAGLLYNHLSRLGLKPFMDSRNMKPGDKLPDQIDSAIRNCKVAVVVFSPFYCQSRHCLRELAFLMESKKRILPIFWDVEPSKLLVKSNGYQFSAKQLRRFRRALEKAKDIVGLTFNPFTGDWSKFLENASDAIEKLLEEERQSIPEKIQES